MSTQQPSKIYKNCIVWASIPVVTWILPFVGHSGIADSKGIIHEFAGSYNIEV